MPGIRRAAALPRWGLRQGHALLPTPLPSTKGGRADPTLPPVRGPRQEPAVYGLQSTSIVRGVYLGDELGVKALVAEGKAKPEQVKFYTRRVPGGRPCPLAAASRPAAAS